MKTIRAKLKDADVLDQFDRVVFESLVEKVIVGEQAEDMCFNCGDHAYRKCSFDDIKIKLEMNTISLSRRTSERM